MLLFVLRSVDVMFASLRLLCSVALAPLDVRVVGDRDDFYLFPWAVRLRSALNVDW